VGSLRSLHRDAASLDPLDKTDGSTADVAQLSVYIDKGLRVFLGARKGYHTPQYVETCISDWLNHLVLNSRVYGFTFSDSYQVPHNDLYNKVLKVQPVRTMLFLMWRIRILSGMSYKIEPLGINKTF
jgi:hypothetical protein